MPDSEHVTDMSIDPFWMMFAFSPMHACITFLFVLSVS